jgi:hypothetical protein
MPQQSVNADAARKGKAVEHLIAASCVLASGAVLNASTSLVDDEGVDIVFHRRCRSTTLAVQVKSRLEENALLAGTRTFATDVRDVTFRPREDLFLLFVVVDPTEPDSGPVWLVPSEKFAEQVKANAWGRRRFVTSAKPTSHDQWSEYRLDKQALAGRLLKIPGGA